MNQFLFEYSEIENCSLGEIKVFIEKSRGILLEELKLKDLTEFNGKKIFPGIGVYIFRDKNRIIYVGKTTSRSFTDRIPSHFDMREVSKMNTLLKKVFKKYIFKDKEDSYEWLFPAHDYAFDNFSLILIHFDEVKVGEAWKTQLRNIELLENILRSILEPDTNTKKMEGIDDGLKLKDVSIGESKP